MNFMVHVAPREGDMLLIGMRLPTVSTGPTMQFAEFPKYPSAPWYPRHVTFMQGKQD